MDQDTKLDKTIQMLGQKYNYIDINERMIITPLSKMIFTTRALCFCLDEKKNKEHIDELEELYVDPILFIIQKHPIAFSEKKKFQMTIKKTLGQLEWIFFRDSHRFTSLKEAYSIDSSKPRETKKITFDDISAIRGFVEMEIDRIFSQVVLENNVNLNPLILPQIDNSIMRDLGLEGGDDRGS